MRKMTSLAVLYFISLCSVFLGGAFFGGQRNRVFFSLAEAVTQPERPLLLVFFSLDCHVCWEDLIEMKYFIEKNDLPVELIGISSDAPPELEDFLDKYSFPYPVVCDKRKELHRRFKVKLEPFKIIIKNDAILYADDAYQDFFARREKVKRCLLEIASK
jgi:peroxiredoxin